MMHGNGLHVQHDTDTILLFMDSPTAWLRVP